MLSKLFGSKAFVKSSLIVAIPIITQQLVSSSVLLVDNVMVGYLGENSLSAVATVNQIIFILYMTAFGISGATGIFVSQYFGAKDDINLKNTIKYKIVVNVVLFLIGTLIIYIFKEFLINLFLKEDVTSFNYAVDYLKFVWPSIIFQGLANIYSTTLRETYNPKYAMFAGITAILVNTILNAILIFGLLGFPALGVVGAAIATSIAKFVEFILSFVFCKKKINNFLPKFREVFKLEKMLSKNITKKAIPLSLNELLWSSAKTILFYFYATRGINAVAGINITNTVSNIAFAIVFGISASVQIIVATTLGENKLKEAKETSRKLINMGFVTALLTSLVLILTVDLFLSIYDVSFDTIEIAKYSIIITAILLPIQSVNVSIYYILRSGGAVKETLFSDTGVTYILTIPVAFLVSILTDLNVIYFFLIVNIVDNLKIFIILHFYKKGIWLNNLTKLDGGN